MDDATSDRSTRVSSQTRLYVLVDPQVIRSIGDDDAVVADRKGGIFQRHVIHQKVDVRDAVELYKDVAQVTGVLLDRVTRAMRR